MTRISGVLVTLFAVTTIAGALLHAQTSDRRLTRPGPPTISRRLALVIGNNAYASAPLRNAVPDATAVAAALRELKFDVTALTDVAMPAMERAIERFVAGLLPDDVALFYFSGHGVQIEGENYLVPVGLNYVDEADVKHGSYSAVRLHEKLEARARIRIVILDACRDNPFRSTRSGQRGLAEMSARGSLIAFATGPGSTASDNPRGQNGLFTEHLLTALREPGVSVSQLFRRVRAAVNDASEGRQFPWLYDGLIGDFVFREAASSPVAAAPAPPPSPTSSNDMLLAAELALWEATQNSRSAVTFEEYLKRYPSGRFRAVAQERLDQLRAAAATPTAASPASAIASPSRPGTREPMRIGVVGPTVLVSAIERTFSTLEAAGVEPRLRAATPMPTTGTLGHFAHVAESFTPTVVTSSTDSNTFECRVSVSVDLRRANGSTVPQWISLGRGSSRDRNEACDAARRDVASAVVTSLVANLSASPR